MYRLAALLTASILACLPTQAAPAIWEVRDDDSAIWLFGSFHVLPAGVEWRTPAFDDLLETADVVIIETDVSPEQQAIIGAASFVRGIYVDGTLLTDRIDDETEAKLRAAAEQLGQPVGSLLAMQPWLAANAITLGAVLMEGYSTDGVELQVESEIGRDRLGFLETGEEQLEVLAGAPEAEQIALLAATLDQLHLLPKAMEKMLDSWIEGTPDDLAALFQTEMGGFEDAFLERLLYARNRNWIGPLEARLAANEQALVIVGTAHLVGKESVVELLEQRGYTVTRIQ